MISDPTLFSPDLTNDRLNVIACLLLDARYSALNDASTELDDRYTQGCLAFGRQRQAIIRAWNNKSYPWLAVSHGGTDLIFRIGTVMIRFFTDDSTRPKKSPVLIPTQAESAQLSIFEPNDTEVVLWRFIVEPAFNDDEGDSVCFIGINAFNEILCRWKYEDSVSVLHSIDNTTPPAKELKPASILPKTENDALVQEQNNVQR
ncbi:MAG: hypothetical protein PHG36_03695 [Dehalococcoidia bacterium]|nr:hypothetical protein [Dehalococcoidia bacterium]